ncbi:MAG: hypothetical protein IJO71_08630 [Microbacterium sp.]|jgi:hypothetical protein|uniref:hypothetical protein n=1 Tax=Microbacterium sp. TaxID=51671 RepID=UPI0025E46AEB|nr:hypothetical protein [Microbacterium sp.]MBQ9917250.1 hypothetical protein [Microbacterium sp.]
MMKPMNISPASLSEVERIGEGFLGCSLPPHEFDHRAHLIAVTYALVRYPELEWTRELPRAIAAFNIAAGGTNDAESGYHHTITMAFLGGIRSITAGTTPTDAVAASDAVLSSRLGRRDVLLDYWKRPTLFSPEARLQWVAPDIRPLDW